MPSFCAIINCQDKYSHSENVSFHKFPHNRKDLLEKWIQFVNRDSNWKPSKWSALCSRHFTQDDFQNVNSRKTLKKSAIPSVRSEINDRNAIESPSENNKNPKLFNKPDCNCRLCGICCRPIATFATNFEIFGMIQKCFPTLNIQLDDNLPKDMCSACLKRLKSFSEFVDGVLSTQQSLQGKFRSEKFIKPPERQLKIKQEPVVNVKQEVADNFDSFLSDELEEEQDCEQKFSFCDFPMLNTQDIINNCDIMEIINLDDPFIDIPDDENGNELDQMESPVFLKPKTQPVLKVDKVNMVQEHSYAMPIECKDSIHFPNVYKTEKAEEEVVSNIELPETLISSNTNSSSTRAEVCEPSIISSSLQFSNTQQTGQKLMVTSVSDLQPRPHAEPNTRKTNIVVLNESIVKSGSGFQLYPCTMCQSQFFSLEGLSHHVTKTHVQPPPMVTLPINSIPNNVVEADSKSLNCTFCSITFTSIQELLKHKIKSHPKTNFKKEKRKRECSYCKRSFKSKIKLNNHCSICIYKSKAPVKIFKCRHCLKTGFRHYRIYRNHETLCKRRLLRNHKLTKNTPKQALKVTKKDVSKKRQSHVTCVENLKEFGSCKDFQTPSKPAKKTAERNIKVKSKTDSSKNTASKSTTISCLLCLGCNTTFESIENFRFHYIYEKCIMKPSADEVLAYCCKCNRPITTFEKLRTHCHFKSKNYSCKECSKVFKKANLLAQHRITHSNEKKHKCELCEKTFKRRNGLAQHMKGYHLKLKPHECAVCKHRFALKWDMLRCRHSNLMSCNKIEDNS